MASARISRSERSLKFRAITPLCRGLPGYNRANVLFLLPVILAVRSFAVDGIVVAVDPVARTMLVSHRAIGRYMPAMMMPFRLESGTELEGVHPGSRVQFELTVNHERSLARNVKVTGEEEAPK